MEYHGSQQYLGVTDTCQVKGFSVVFLKAQFWLTPAKPDHSVNVSTGYNTKRKEKLSLALRSSTGHSYASICLDSELEDFKQHLSHFQSGYFDEKYVCNKR